MAKGKKRERAHNWQGSVWERKDGRYGAELPVRGVRGVEYLSTTKRDEVDALRWLNKMRHDRDEGLLLAPGSDKLTLAAYLKEWLASIEGTVSRHTHRDYADKVRLHINPMLGGVKLKELTSLDLEKLYRTKTREGQSARSVRYIHTTLGKALHQAEAWDLVRKNVARFAKPPKPDADEREPMSPEEIRAFLAAVQGHRDEALYLLATTTGMRRGELFGLKWEDLDLGAGRYKVRRSLDTHYGPAAENDTKRKASRRPGILLPPVIASLRRHADLQRADRLSAGPRWEEHGYVFPTNRGTPQRADNVSKRSLKPLCEEHGLRHLTFTDLRHSVATFLALLDVHPKTAQRILGHGSVTTTLAVYTHALDEMHEDAVGRLGELLFGEKRGRSPVTFLSDARNGAEEEGPEMGQSPANTGD